MVSKKRITMEEAQAHIDALVKAGVLYKTNGYLMGGSYVNPHWDIRMPYEDEDLDVQ